MSSSTDSFVNCNHTDASAHHSSQSDHDAPITHQVSRHAHIKGALECAREVCCVVVGGGYPEGHERIQQAHGPLQNLLLRPLHKNAQVLLLVLRSRQEAWVATNGDGGDQQTRRTMMLRILGMVIMMTKSSMAKENGAEERERTRDALTRVETQ